MTDTPADQTETRPRAKLLDLSLTQLIGGSMAAATAAFLGSRLGVVGTIAGAAVGSMVTAIAANIYTASMARARVAFATARMISPRPLRPTLRPMLRPTLWRLPDRVGTRRMLATAGVVFAVAAAFLAGLQLATGASVTGTTIGTRSAQAGSVVEPPRTAADAADDAANGQSGPGPTSTATTSPVPAATGTPSAPPTTVAPTTASPGTPAATPSAGASGGGTPASGSSATPAPPAAGSTTSSPAATTAP